LNENTFRYYSEKQNVKTKTQQKSLWHGTLARIIITHAILSFNLNVEPGTSLSFGL
jgi:hypothetical protein